MTGEKALMRLAVSAGEVLLQNGAEIYRVQETITRILDAFQVCNYSVYVVSNVIIASLNEDSDHGSFTVRYVPISQFHLGRIVAVNDLSRQIVQAPDFSRLGEYHQKLEQHALLPFFPHWLRVLACGIGTGSFCFLFGGTLSDSLAAAVNGFLLQIYLLYHSKAKGSRYIPTILGAALVSLFAVMATSLFGSLSRDYIIIGTIMPLVPGVSFTTAIRDFFNGDYVSGNIHITDALLTAICIAAGVGAMLALMNWLGGLP